jgi:pimeloyl-ACP methyl ester carboxylesterase
VKRSLIGSAAWIAAAATGSVLIADHKVTAARRAGSAGQDRFAAPRPDRSGFLRTTDGIRLHYEEDGPIDAPLSVVFVHGFCLDRDDFLFQRRAVRDAFGAGVRVISYDQRSHGRSGRSAAADCTIDRLGEDLALLLDELVPVGPLLLAGHSMGGMTIMALADARPQLFGVNGRVAAVALLSTSTGKLAALTLGMPAVLARVRRPALALMLRGARRESALVERGRARAADVAWIFVRRLAFGKDVDPAVVEFVTRMVGATPVDVIADFYPALMSHDKLAALGALTATRVLVICGEDDLLTPPEHGEVIARALPNAQMCIVPGAGHQAHMERPQLVNPLLVQLIQTSLAS